MLRTAESQWGRRGRPSGNYGARQWRQCAEFPDSSWELPWIGTTQNLDSLSVEVELFGNSFLYNGNEGAGDQQGAAEQVLGTSVILQDFKKTATCFTAGIKISKFVEFHGLVCNKNKTKYKKTNKY